MPAPSPTRPEATPTRQATSPHRPPRRRRTDSLIPGWLWLPAFIGIVFLLLPIIGMLTRVDPQSLLTVITAEESRLAMQLSLLTSVTSALISVLIGFPLGHLLATRAFPGQRIVRTLILLPLVLPPVVSGLALLYTWGRSAILGGGLESAGLSLAYTTSAVIMAQVFVSLPFMVMSVETATAGLGRRYELTAAELGAKPNRVFFTVTLPLLRHGIITGAVLCFARSLGEFGATLTFAGSLSGVTRTMPLQIYLVRESDPQAAIGLSLLLIIIAVLIIILAYRSPHAPELKSSHTTSTPTPTEAALHSADTARSRGGESNPEPRSQDHMKSTAEISAEVRLKARGIELDLTSGLPGTTAIIGRNGAGKSTLFHVLTGALTPDSGRLRIGQDTVFDIAAGLWPPIHDRGIVHLAQNPLLFPHLNVIDNVSFGLRAHGSTRRCAHEQAQAMLDRLGVGQCANRRPDAVSGGQAARIALARALVVEPKLLLLDEPLAALDVDVAVKTRQVLAQLLQGRSALLITHDVDDVTALADSLVLVENGAVAYSAPIGQVDPEATGEGAEFLTSFCMRDRDGIMCNQSQ
ncbi:molybdate transport system permease protein [Brevibacterium siliguriense]|uniref:Molybdate transport system permease protein n=1 Tax=Brevibacterium siliguriense TaxID=1136497 RepID=A0A1H1UML2_9MICO|nr:ABC transporter permease [Brevibacterium siliguriense]SDS73742.1 molybdate transport system permease protein [Brevibacterium siliguriense]